jgi:hypothetical protein
MDESSSTMKADHNYAEMLEMMRSQGSKDNPTTVQLGVMQSANSVKIDDLVLNAEDLYIADYLVAGYTREIKIPYVSGVTVDTTQSDPFGTVDANGAYHDPDTRTTTQSKITYTDGLKKGDMVAVQKLNDNNKYVILARVVSA